MIAVGFVLILAINTICYMVDAIIIFSSSPCTPFRTSTKKGHSLGLASCRESATNTPFLTGLALTTSSQLSCCHPPRS